MTINLADWTALANVFVLIGVFAMQAWNSYQHQIHKQVLAKMENEVTGLKVYMHEKFPTKEEVQQLLWRAGKQP